MKGNCEIMGCNERAKEYIRLKRKNWITNLDKKPMHVCKAHRKIYIKNLGYKDTDSPTQNACGICYGCIILLGAIVGIFVAILMVM